MSVLYLPHDNQRLFIQAVAILPVNDKEAISTGNFRVFKALVDTGATHTCITRHAADLVGCEPIGKISVQGVSGIGSHNRFLFYIGFIVRREVQEHQLEGRIAMLSKEITGIDFESDGTFDVLLGMDVISTGSLKIEGNNTASFSF